MIRVHLLSVSLLLLGLLSSVSVAEENLRILFIGNSYTGQVRQSVAGLFAASPHAKAELEFITPGGRTLAQHLENEKTVAKIEEGDWDFVVLQDQSQTPAVFPDRFHSAAKELVRLIDRVGARTVFYQTWGRRDGDKQNPGMFPDYESMQKALSKEYRDAARRGKALLAPVGEAWSIVRKENEDLGKRLYKNDGSHPSGEGAFLAACVFYTVLTGADAGKVPYTGGIEEKEAEVIRSAAAKVTAR